MNLNSKTTFKGDVKTKVIRAPRAPLSWHIRNIMRLSYWEGVFGNMAAVGLSKLTGMATFTSELSLKARIMDEGQRQSYEALQERLKSVDPSERLVIQDKLNRFVSSIPFRNYGVVGRRVVTTVGVNYLATDWNNNTTDISNMNFHGSGSSSTSEAVGDTTLAAEITSVARVAGVKTNPSANVLQTVATLAYTGNNGVTEHGIFSSGSVGAGVSTLWDRTVFAVINVANGDSIQFTYQCTITAGG